MRKELLIELLQQSNEHLRATDTKANQLYYFFILLSGYYITSTDYTNNSVRSILLNTFLSILGVILIFVIIRYQEWHAIYVNDSIVIQRIMYLYKDENDDKLTLDKIDKIFCDLKQTKIKKNKEGIEDEKDIKAHLFMLLSLGLILVYILYRNSIYYVHPLDILKNDPLLFFSLITFVCATWILLLVMSKFLPRVSLRTLYVFLKTIISKKEKRHLNEIPGDYKKYPFITKSGAEYFLFNSLVIVNYMLISLFPYHILNMYKISNYYVDFPTVMSKEPILLIYMSAFVLFIYFLFFFMYVFSFNIIRQEILGHTKKEYFNKSWILSTFKESLYTQLS